MATPRLEFFCQQSADKAHGAVDEHINGVCHAEVGAAPSELAGKRQGEQAEEGSGGGKQALDPDTCKHTPTCHFCDLHWYSPLLLQRAEVQTQITTTELTGSTAGAQPVDHIGDVFHLKERHAFVHFLPVFEVLAGQVVDELDVALGLAHGGLDLGGADIVDHDAGAL